MKTPLLLAASLTLLVCSPSRADDGGSYTFIKTNLGKVYTNCHVVQVDPDGVYIVHQNGVAKLLFAELPEDARTTLGYNAEKASQYEKDRADAKRKEREELWKYRCEVAKAETAAYNAEAARQQAMATQTFAGGGYGVEGYPGFGYTTSYGYDYGTGYNGGFGNRFGCSPLLGNGIFNRNRYTFPTPANAGINVIGRNVFSPQPCRVPLATPAMGRPTPALGAGKH